MRIYTNIEIASLRAAYEGKKEGRDETSRFIDSPELITSKVYEKDSRNLAPNQALDKAVRS